ncbi:MAG: hypothetical protein WCV90_01880 [Candidatus Woesearchaeota archaeon]
MDKKQDDSDKNNINNEQLLSEIKGTLKPTEDEGKPEEIERAIVFDGTQYSARIPRKFADAVGLSTEKHKVKFYLEVSKDRKYPPKIKAEVIEK